MHFKKHFRKIDLLVVKGIETIKFRKSQVYHTFCFVLNIPTRVQVIILSAVHTFFTQIYSKTKNSNIQQSGRGQSTGSPKHTHTHTYTSTRKGNKERARADIGIAGYYSAAGTQSTRGPAAVATSARARKFRRRANVSASLTLAEKKRSAEGKESSRERENEKRDSCSGKIQRAALGPGRALSRRVDNGDG